MSNSFGQGKNNIAVDRLNVLTGALPAMLEENER